MQSQSSFLKDVLLPGLVVILLLLVNNINAKNDDVFTWNHYESNFRFVVPYFGLKYAGTAGNYIDNSVLQFGAFEKPELNLLRNVSEGLKSHESSFLDIGANTGLYSLFMSTQFKTVYSVEPFPPVLEELRNNIALNKIENILVLPIGFGAEEGKIPFYAPPAENQGIGTFSVDHTEKGNDNTKLLELSLPIRKGDSALKELASSKISLIKLDIEGYEKLALVGLKETMNMNRPIVLMELNCHNPESFKSIDELIAAYPKDYMFVEILSHLNGLITGEYKLLPLSFDNTQKNILAFPSEMKPLIDSVQYSDRLL